MREQEDNKAEIERLKSESDDQKAQIEQWKQEMEDAKKNAKTTDDLRILNAVKIAGGEKALKAIESNYKPEGRKKEDKRAEEAAEGKAPTSAEIIARLNEIKKGKKK